MDFIQKNAENDEMLCTIASKTAAYMVRLLDLKGTNILDEDLVLTSSMMDATRVVCGQRTLY